MSKTAAKQTAYRSYGMARKNADPENGIVVRVGDLYIVGEFSSITSVDLIRKDGSLTGTVNLGHLDRLGNANWAKADSSKTNFTKRIFDTSSMRDEVADVEPFKEHIRNMITEQDVKDFQQIGSIPWCEISDDQKERYAGLSHILAEVCARIFHHVKKQ